ncbi:helix-turn-helix transcriptional regulator, partial [Enterococcus hirae]
ASIRNYEAGTTYPNVERLLRLANFFDVPLDYFFKE